MATCKLCKRNGVFLSINQFNLCSTCNTNVMIEINSRLRVFTESMNLVETGKSLEVRVSRLDLVIKEAEEMKKFEDFGIPITKPSLSETIKIYTEKRKNLIIQGLIDITKTALEKTKLTTSVKSKVNILSKVVMQILDYKKEYPNYKELDNLETGIRKTIQEIQLKGFIEDAQKAELKNNTKKALENYYEALYFIQHDDIDDNIQANSIKYLEDKIKELNNK